jgi:hypothetical protein
MYSRPCALLITHYTKKPFADVHIPILQGLRSLKIPFYNPILFAICTSTFSKPRNNLYSGMQKSAH